MSTHIDAEGNVIMVDISAKAATERVAVAQGCIHMSAQAMHAIKEKTASKGDVLTVAQLAGIMGAKQTASLIPLCHPIPLTSCTVTFTVHDTHIVTLCTAKTTGQTGIEMEALSGVSMALLTVYDMLKGIDKSMTISDICLVEKSGGKSGHYKRLK